MGMSASQGNFLALTGRVSDIEFKAQSIQSQKLSLATQKDALYEEYCFALDNATIKVGFRDGVTKKYVDANFNNLCSWNEYRMSQYAIRNNETGKIIVSQEVFDAYNSYSDKYTFAYAMMGFDNKFGWGEYNKSMGKNIGVAAGDKYMTECEQYVFNAHNDDVELINLYSEIQNAESSADKQKALNEFRDKLYSTYSTEIYMEMNYSKETSSKTDDSKFINKTWNEMQNQFNYYVNLWVAIKNAGGCEVIDQSYAAGENGNKWFNGMVNAGKIGIMIFNTDVVNGEWRDTSVATNVCANNLQEEVDNDAIKKAEIKYEHDLDVLNQKDTEFDTELSNLETERAAIAKELDAIANVRKENIDRTFGIFS